MSEKLNKINKELKIYINESSFISMKCRNKLLEYFNEEFELDLDINNYKNVDLYVTEDYKIIYREDTYTPRDGITSMKELEDRYQRFKEKADKLLEKKEIDFQSKGKFNDISNLFIILGIFALIILIIVLSFHAIINGNYFDSLWLVLIIIPSVIPKLRESLQNRLIQAKNYLKKNKKK